MTYTTIFPERAAVYAEVSGGYFARTGREATLQQPPDSDAGPGAEVFEAYRRVHGVEPCPGEACTSHGGRIAVRKVVTTTPL